MNSIPQNDEQLREAVRARYARSAVKVLGESVTSESACCGSECCAPEGVAQAQSVSTTISRVIYLLYYGGG